MDAALADRLAALLGGIPEIQLVATDEPADVNVVTRMPGGSTGLDDPLTPREEQVLGLLAQGASNKLIARQLGISVHTAKYHVGQLLTKLEAIGRVDAVAQAARLGVLQL
ncbi:MAG: helix-turn-helix transcriptional regulator [Sinobacteraceae bacterium]|nr:helix-turn-helix transcriptional regulator [Nevskiaceae bacterium]